jgi:diadenosine tetraphosphate (Ap4A) HIT family hydrolase
MEVAMSEEACFFCRVVAALQTSDVYEPSDGGPPLRKIAERPASLVLLGADQAHRGYAFVVARTHATELFHLPPDEARRYLADMVDVARAIDAAFRPRKLNYELLGNTVPHLHWHLIPRYADDPNPTRPVWERPAPPRVASREEQAETIAAIAKFLGAAPNRC